MNSKIALINKIILFHAVQTEATYIFPYHGIYYKLENLKNRKCVLLESQTHIFYYYYDYYYYYSKGTPIWYIMLYLRIPEEGHFKNNYILHQHLENKADLNLPIVINGFIPAM